MIHINPQITPINLKNIKLDKKYSTVPGLLRWIKEEAEVLWFAVMLVLVIGFFSWTLVDLTTGVSTSYRYGLPLFSASLQRLRRPWSTSRRIPPPITQRW